MPAIIGSTHREMASAKCVVRFVLGHENALVALTSFNAGRGERPGAVFQLIPEMFQNLWCVQRPLR
jgi:hypothetical protein